MATISGGDGGNVITGGSEDDVLYGHSAADLLPNAGEIVATTVATGFDAPVVVTNAPGDPDRLYVVEKNQGRILLLDTDTGTRTVFMALPAGDFVADGEQGLLGLAFHPDYETNGQFFVHVVNPAGDIEIRRYTRSAADPDVADLSSREVLITIPHPTFQNHNGGMLAFGPDGYLYVSLGDGGGGGDPNDSAQNIDNLLGKILRLDVDSDGFPSDPTRNYAIPSGNPFVGVAGADEVWAMGLRNPWRFSFDSLTGDLYIGDVGQVSLEEIDFQAAGAAGGANYGWDNMEGSLIFEGPDDPSFVDPVHEYGRSLGQAVTGGYVYRGPAPGMQGTYLFADFISNRLWSLRIEDGHAVDVVERTGQIAGIAPNMVATFGTDENHELYMVNLTGEILRLSPSASAGDGHDTISGGGGNDLIVGGVGNDIIDGGTGEDTASFAGFSATVYADLRTGGGHVGGVLSDVMTSIEHLVGGGGNDVLVGNTSGNSLAGGTGTDELVGLDGDDVLLGGSASFGEYNVLFGGNGSDTASYAGEASAVTASLTGFWAYVGGVAAANLTDTYSSIENLSGGNAGDVLIGDAAANRLAGGAGADQLYGGGGADSFVYAGFADSNLSAGYDTVADFVAGTDRLDLAALNTDSTHVSIHSSGGVTAVYVSQVAGVRDSATDIAIAFLGDNALSLADIVF